MALKKLTSPSSGSADKWYGVDYNELVDNVEGRSITQRLDYFADPFSGVQWGAYMGTTNATDLGILNGTTSSGTQSNGEDTDGSYRQFATGGTLGTVAGKKKDAVWGRRENNCLFSSKFKISNTSSASRNCHGLTTDTNSLTNTDTFLANADSGVMVGFRTTDTNWSIFHNDGTGAMVVVSLGIAKDTNAHRVEIRAIAASNNFVVRFDNATPVTLSTRIPGSAIPLSVRHQIINATATDINLRIYGMYVETRKLT